MGRERDTVLAQKADSMFGPARPKYANGKTWRRMVQDIGFDVLHREITNDEADYVLWEHTGFPAFFEGDDAEAWFSKQAREFFEQVA